jgi:hypothetical protein
LQAQGREAQEQMWDEEERQKIKRVEGTVEAA